MPEFFGIFSTNFFSINTIDVFSHVQCSLNHAPLAWAQSSIQWPPPPSRNTIVEDHLLYSVLLSCGLVVGMNAQDGNNPIHFPLLLETNSVSKMLVSCRFVFNC